MMSRHALVTGGCGFIGSNLTRRLVNDGWNVTVVDDLSSGHLSLLDDVSGVVRVDTLDFADPIILNRIAIGSYDVVFHLAAIPRVSFSVENPSVTNDTNVGKTVQLLEACAKSSRRPVVVFSSSSSVYGGADVLPTRESESTNPKSPYALQKRVIEDYLKVFYGLYGLKSVALRYFNVFGPGQYGDSPYSTAVAAWCHAVKNGTSCRLDGDGEQTRDMTYVDNVVEANIRAAGVMLGLEGTKYVWDGRTYNVGCGDRVSNNEILQLFKAHFQGRQVLQIKNAPARQGDVKHTQADVSRAEDELGYRVNVRFNEGLERTWKWWGL